MPKLRYLLYLLILLVSCKPKEQNQSEAKREPTMLYGIVVDSLEVEQQEVQKGDNLSVILDRHGLSGQVVQQVVDAAAGTFDVRAIRVGQTYTTISDSGSLRYWIYEKDLVSYFIFDFTDSLPKVQRIDRPVETHLRSLGGVINSSLFKTVLDAGATQELAVRLAGVFDWTVDFFSIQKGDYFRVVYEEQTVEGKPYGTGKIIAAEFFSRNKSNYALLWENGKPNQYYNDKGESMRKRYLKAPLEYSRISSRFSSSRLHPVLKTRRPHLGTDYAAPTGTPIRSIGDGVVLEAGYRGGNGNFVKVKHNKNHATGYLHMSRIAKGIRSGVRVSQGQVIGYVGSTGLATGPHLCFRFWENGVQVNPARIQTPAADPLPQKDKAAFFAHRDSLMVKLQAIQLVEAN